MRLRDVNPFYKILVSELREFIFCLLREAARILGESKISDEKSNFFLFCQNIQFIFCLLLKKGIQTL